MLMQKPKRQADNAHENVRGDRELLVDSSPHSILLGQFILILLFVIAILLRSMS